jgi:hypothetical protein
MRPYQITDDPVLRPQTYALLGVLAALLIAWAFG